MYIYAYYSFELCLLVCLSVIANFVLYLTVVWPAGRKDVNKLIDGLID